METKRATIRFPADVKESLDRLAKNTGASVQFSVVAAVRAYLQTKEVREALKKKRGA